MAKNKTNETDQDVLQFIDQFADTDQKKSDSLELIHLMEKATGERAKMWGPTIVGFGKYHYQYASGHRGEAPLLGFSPRKDAISLYVYIGNAEHEPLVKALGKIKMSKACIYVKKLSDIDLKALDKLMRATTTWLRKNHSDTE